MVVLMGWPAFCGGLWEVCVAGREGKEEGGQAVRSTARARVRTFIIVVLMGWPAYCGGVSVCMAGREGKEEEGQHG
jgi:hypothetical protein